MKIGQINAQRAMAAMADLEVLIKELDFDILCIQEPYVARKKTTGFTDSELVRLQPRAGDPWVASIISNKEIETFQLSHMDTKHVMCFQVLTGDNDFYIINAYCQFSLEIEPILNDIEKIINSINSQRLMILMDSNAKSRLWYAGDTDDRGKAVEEFLITNRLHVLNEASELTTYSSGQGSSNIDITIVSEALIGSCSGWKVLDVCTTSDHNLIIFKTLGENKKRRIFQKQNRFNTKKADWNAFDEMTKHEFSDVVNEKLKTDEPNRSVYLFNQILTGICPKTIPRHYKLKNGVSWWSKELADMRRE